LVWALGLFIWQTLDYYYVTYINRQEWWYGGRKHACFNQESLSISIFLTCRVALLCWQKQESLLNMPFVCIHVTYSQKHIEITVSNTSISFLKLCLFAIYQFYLLHKYWYFMIKHCWDINWSRNYEVWVERQQHASWLPVMYKTSTRYADMGKYVPGMPPLRGIFTKMSF
jgi:hypothetical protein